MGRACKVFGTGEGEIGFDGGGCRLLAHVDREHRGGMNQRADCFDDLIRRQVERVRRGNQQDSRIDEQPRHLAVATNHFPAIPFLQIRIEPAAQVFRVQHVDVPAFGHEHGFHFFGQEGFSQWYQDR